MEKTSIHVFWLYYRTVIYNIKKSKEIIQIKVLFYSIPAQVLL